MKQFYRLLSLFFMVILSTLTARAASITLNVDNPDAIKVEVFDPVTFKTRSITLKKGSNPIAYDADASNQMTIRACDGFSLESVKADGNYPDLTVMLSQANTMLDASINGRSYTVKTFNLEDRRTASVTVKVIDDNPDISLINYWFGKDNTWREITKNPEVIKFNPSDESNFTFFHVDHQPFCRLTLNGVVVNPTFSEYRCSLKDGDIIEIRMDFPDTMIPVKISYPEGLKDAVSRVTVNNEPVSNWDSDDFAVKSGSNLAVEFNNMSQDFKIDNVVVNGQVQAGFLLTYLVTLDPVTIEINAHFIGSYSVTLDIDDPSRIKIYNGMGIYGDTVEVTSSPAVVEVSELQPYLSFTALPGYMIVAVADGEGKKFDISPLQPYVRVTDGMTIHIETAEIKYDSKFTFFIPEIEHVTNAYWMTYANRVQNKFVEGYNIIGFNMADQDQHLITMYGDYDCVDVYINDEKWETAGGSFNWSTVPEDGDVIKVFFGGEPARHDVTVSLDESLTGMVDVITDKVKTRDDFSSMSLHEGSHVGIRPADGYSVKVYADGQPVAVSVDGTHDIYVASAHDIEVLPDSESGVGSIETADNEKVIYNLQGIAVGASANLNELPRGIYIYRGKKVIVK